MDLVGDSLSTADDQKGDDRADDDGTDAAKDRHTSSVSCAAMAATAFADVLLLRAAAMNERKSG